TLRFSARRAWRRRRERRGRSGIRRLTPQIVPCGHARAWGAATLADSPTHLRARPRERARPRDTRTVCRGRPLVHYRPPVATSATGVVVLPGSHVSCGWIHHDFRSQIKVDPPAGDALTPSSEGCTPGKA